MIGESIVEDSGLERFLRPRGAIGLRFYERQTVSIAAGSNEHWDECAIYVLKQPTRTDPQKLALKRHKEKQEGIDQKSIYILTIQLLQEQRKKNEQSHILIRGASVRFTDRRTNRKEKLFSTINHI